MGGIKDNYKSLAPSLNSINGEYFRWLCEIADLHNHLFLAADLFDKEFVSYVPNDDNRRLDGMALRDEFADEFVYTISDTEEFPCSVLEMIIGVAKRLEFQTNEDYKHWIKVLLTNLQLYSFTDTDYYDCGGFADVRIVLHNLVERRYTRDGIGSLFPVKRSNYDNAEIEIWYQMQYWLHENYEF